MQHLSTQTECLSGTTMEERALSLLESGLGSDCEFLVGQQEPKVSIKASKVFLVRASPVFERMFFGSFPETKPIEVPDIEPDAFWIMLKYIYGCKWGFTNNEQASYVCYAAHKYMLLNLMARCEEYLWPHDVSNLWIAFKCSSLLGMDNLKEACIQIIKEHAEAVFESPEFLKLSKSCLIDILKTEDLRIGGELEIFNGCRKWAEARCKTKGIPATGENERIELGEAIGYIRFLIMPTTEFAASVVKTGILTSEEALCILVKMLVYDSPPLPETFCNEAQIRCREGMTRLMY